MSTLPEASPPPDEEAYISEEDEDFDPTAVEATRDVSSDSSSDSEQEQPQALKKGRKPKFNKHALTLKHPEAEDAGFENSGDEGIINKGTKRKRKGSHASADSGGEGGFVKTRSMRAVA